MKLFNFFKKDKSPRLDVIIDVTDKDFKKQVLQRSHKTPVLVDFWAAWCGPCRQLGPVLEQLAEDPESEFILAKLDTEANRRSAAQYHIHSIPAVKMFRNGQVVGEFTGARPKVLVKRFVEDVLSKEPPAPKVTGSDDPQKRLQQARQHLLKGRGFEGFVLLNNFPESDEAAEAERLLPLAGFLIDMDFGDGLTGDEELDQAHLDAAKAAQKRQPETALAALMAARGHGDEAEQEATETVIRSYFVLLGEEHELTQKYRPQLEEPLA